MFGVQFSVNDDKNCYIANNMKKILDSEEQCSFFCLKTVQKRVNSVQKRGSKSSIPIGQ